MPNHCENILTITGDKKEIKRCRAFIKGNEKKQFIDFNNIIPMPKELVGTRSPMNIISQKEYKEQEERIAKANKEPNWQDSRCLTKSLSKSYHDKFGADNWYDWSVMNWGTKWNTTANGIERTGEMTIRFSCETAWAPPTRLYERISEGEFGEYDVNAYYLEEGMAFVGRFEDGFDECYEYSDLESLDSIPEVIVEHWNLREQLEDQEDWDAEEALNDIIDNFKGENMENQSKGSQVNTPEGREWLRGLLQNEEVTITFTKKDGTEREMLCTLKPDFIPSEKAPKNSGKAQSDESIAVFDLDKEEWRSFRWDSVRKIEFSLGE